MSTISNRFFVSAIDDGTTLHGNLTSTKTLTQGWNGSAWVPNMSISDNQPTIYLTLLNGNAYETPDSSNIHWYLNNTEITFDNNNPPTSTNFNNAFQKITYSVGGKNMPALKIVDNLLGSSPTSSVDLYNITFKGSFSGIEFSATTQLRITEITASGYLGVVDFKDGASNFTEDNDTVTVYGVLYGGSDGQIVPTSGWYTSYVFDETTHSANTSVTVGTNTFSAYQLGLNDVTDNIIVEVKFKKYPSNEDICSAFVSIDDMTDNEHMYIQYSNANGQTAQLRTPNDEVEFVLWIAKIDDATAIDTDYNTFKAQFRDAAGNVIYDTTQGTSIFGANSYIGAADTNGYRSLGATSVSGKYHCVISYANVVQFGKNIEAVVIASHTE